MTAIDQASGLLPRSASRAPRRKASPKVRNAAAAAGEGERLGPHTSLGLYNLSAAVPAICYAKHAYSREGSCMDCPLLSTRCTYSIKPPLGTAGNPAARCGDVDQKKNGAWCMHATPTNPAAWSHKVHRGMRRVRAASHVSSPSFLCRGGDAA